MSSVEPTSDVWEHGLLPLPGAKLSEASLLALLELQHRPPADLSIGLEQWAPLAAEGLSMRREQAAACMRLCYVLSPSLQTPTQPTRKLPADEAMRVPLGSLLLLLWVQVAQRELGHGTAGLTGKAQAASGDVWPSPSPSPPAADVCARTLAVQARMSQLAPPAAAPASAAARQRRRLLQASLPTLLRLLAAGAGRLYAHELELLGLLLRPDRVSATRLAGRGLPPSSLACALGLWSTQPAAALPVSALLPALRAALTEVLAPATAAAEAKAAAAAAASAAAEASPPVSPRPPKSPGAAGRSPQSWAVPPVSPMGLSLQVTTSDDERAAPSRGTLQIDEPIDGAAAAAAASYDGFCARLVGAKRRTVVLRESELRGAALQIVDCHSCFVYVLAPVRAAELLGCVNCTVFVGAVCRVLSATYCERLHLHAASQALRVGNCLDCALHVCVNSPPLLWGENHRISLAPLAATYDGFDAHLAAAAIATDLHSNCWRRPFCAASAAPPPSAAAAASSSAAAPAAAPASPKAEGWSILPPAKMLPFHVPFDVPPPAAARPLAEGGLAPACALPPEYDRALTAKFQRVADFQRELAGIECPPELRAEVQATLQSHFKEWLVRTGNMRQITDLLKLADAEGAGGGSHS